MQWAALTFGTSAAFNICRYCRSACHSHRSIGTDATETDTREHAQIYCRYHVDQLGNLLDW
jgi:hypothetical protein